MVPRILKILQLQLSINTMCNLNTNSDFGSRKERFKKSTKLVTSRISISPDQFNFLKSFSIALVPPKWFIGCIINHYEYIIAYPYMASSLSVLHKPLLKLKASPFILPFWTALIQNEKAIDKGRNKNHRGRLFKGEI